MVTLGVVPITLALVGLGMLPARWGACRLGREPTGHWGRHCAVRSCGRARGAFHVPEAQETAIDLFTPFQGQRGPTNTDERERQEGEARGREREIMTADERKMATTDDKDIATAYKREIAMTEEMECATKLSFTEGESIMEKHTMLLMIIPQFIENS